MRYEEGEDILLIDTVGRVIASRDELQTAEMADVYLESVIAQSHVGTEGLIPSVAYVSAVKSENQKSGWVTWRDIAGTKWRVIVQQDAGQIGGVFEGIIVIFLLVTIVASMFGIMNIRQYHNLIFAKDKLGKFGINQEANK
jgi:hypothetical protein